MTMNVKVYPPNTPAYTTQISSFRDLQAMVKGYVEICTIGGKDHAVNDAGLLVGLLPNMHFGHQNNGWPLRGIVVELPLDWDQLPY